MPLGRYREKRDLERTPEPSGALAREGSLRRNGGIFVIQKHDASRLHYDFRLEMEGVLRSWAVPKGPSLDPRDRRLAVMVEDHPLEYGDFEGIIPPDNYGAGAVIVWDRGIYRASSPGEDVAAAVAAGKLDFSLRGFKLGGDYTLVRAGGRQGGARAADKQQWLLIKKRDSYATEDDVLAVHPRSVLSGLLVEEMYEASAMGHAIGEELARAGTRPLTAALNLKNFPLALAKLAERPFDGKDWLFELKYDGVRALAIRDGARSTLLARSGTDITAVYPEVALAICSLPLERFVLDGEIVALDEQGRPNFQLLQRRMHLSDRRDIQRTSYAVPVHYFAFDLLAFGDFDLREMELERRKRTLAHIVKSEGPLRYCEHIPERGREFYQVVAEAGLEGIMAKRRSAPYRKGRSGDWLKIKCPLTRRFVIGGYTDPAGSRLHFGALLLGQYASDGGLRFIDKVGTGFNRERLNRVADQMRKRPREKSPFRTPEHGEPPIPRRAHFCQPELVCEVRFTEWTNRGGIRHPSFQRLVTDAEPRQCLYEGPETLHKQPPMPAPRPADRSFVVSNRDKVFWPGEGYTKGALIDYYLALAPFMLPYLADRPVMLTRYPDGIAGKSFYQKDAPGFAPAWLRTAKIYSSEARREIAYFIVESAEALAYLANLGAITIHVWSSRLPTLERPDWLLFDIDPKGTTTARAIRVAAEVGAICRELGLRPYIKTSGQAGLHVVVGLASEYTYEQARMFSELVARLVIARLPHLATINRNPASRRGKVYIDYLQLGYGKTIAAPFSVRPLPGAPVSAPIKWTELAPDLDPARFNLKTMPGRMAKLHDDPFLGALEDPMRLEQGLPKLEQALRDAHART